MLEAIMIISLNCSELFDSPKDCQIATQHFITLATCETFKAQVQHKTSNIFLKENDSMECFEVQKPKN